MRAAWILALVLCLALAFWFRGQPGDIAPTEQVPPERASNLAAPHAEPVEADPIPVRDSTSPLRESVARISHGSIHLRVVDKTTGAPAPRARVWLQRAEFHEDSPTWIRARWTHGDIELVLASGLGSELFLDAAASVRVAIPERVLLVAAADGNRHGVAQLVPGTGECVVELEPHRELVFEVVETSGRPVAGAHVFVVSGRVPFEREYSFSTDRDGLLRLPKLESQLALQDERDPIRATLGGGAACRPEHVLFDLRSLPDRPVRFVASDFGSVEVQLVDVAGSPITLPGWASIELEREGPVPEGLGGSMRFQRVFQDGRARFPCVGLGASLTVWAQAEGHAGDRRFVRGPEAPGDALEVLVPVGRRHPRVRGSVVGLDEWLRGSSPGRARLEGRATEGAGYVDLLIRQQGGFEGDCHVEWSRIEPAAPWTFELWVDDELHARAQAVPKVRRSEWVIDFGALAFDALPVLAYVRVRDDLGRPVQRASIRTLSVEGRSARALSCDENGVCDLRGLPAELPLLIRASSSIHSSCDWVEVASLGSSLELVLHRGASLQGSLVLPAGTSRDDFEVELTVDLGVGSRGTHRSELVEGARFFFVNCEAGSAELSIHHGEQEVLRRGGLVLHPGETLLLAPIELALHPYELSFALASGEPWRGGHLELVAPGGGLQSWVDIDSTGRAAFLAPWPTLTLWAAGLGARATRFEGVRDGDRLVLAPAPVVELVVPTACVPPEPHRLVPRLLRIEPEELEFEPTEDVDEERAEVGPDGRARLRPSYPGRYELHWSLRHALADEEVRLQLDAPQELVVGDEDLRVVVELDPLAVERALEVARAASLAQPGR